MFLLKKHPEEKNLPENGKKGSWNILICHLYLHI